MIEVEPSDVAWIDLESFIPASKGADMNESEILFLPCTYQTQQEMNFEDYIRTSGNYDKLSESRKRRIDKIKNLTCRKTKLITEDYKSIVSISLDELVSKFEQYRQNLIKLSEATKEGYDTTELSKQILEFKNMCSGFIKSQFYKIDMDLDKMIQQSISHDQIQIEKNSTMQEVHIGNTGRMFSIKSPDGVEKYYFKPAESKDKVAKPYRAYIQEAAYNVQKIINPSRAVKCGVCNINGEFGAIQEKIEIDKEATKQFYRYFSGDGGKLSPKILSQILDEYLVDYCLCNYDAHAHNFVIDVNGNLRGIDKEQSFRYINSDLNDDMLFSQNYNEEYGESETIYATIFKKMETGEISDKVLEGLNYRSARLAQISDEKYREIFKNYAFSKTKTPEEAQMLLDRIVNRKQSILKKVDMLKQTIGNKSYGKEKGNDEYMFTDNIPLSQNISPQQKKPIQRPHIKQSVIQMVAERDAKKIEQIPWANNKKEELIKQRQDLRRTQFQQRTAQMGLNQSQVPNLNDIFRQQQMQQQIKHQQQLIEEEEMDHGMSM